MEDLKYYIWLSQAFSIGSAKQFEIASRFLNLKQFYDMTEEQMLKFDILNKADVSSLKSTSMARVDLILDNCEKAGIKIVKLNDKLFPFSLTQIYAPPIVLYYKGDIGCLNEHLAIGVVGTRRINDYSRRITFKLANEMAKHGVVIVSGGANGVDEVAHEGAILAKSKTVAVMACGLDVNYPANNEKQRYEILELGGVLLSELPPKTTVSSKYFATRNRLISGLSKGVLITHAPVRSGALLTAEHAIEQGKDLFCIPPWDIEDLDCLGVMKYIRDGCKVVSCCDDILNEYSVVFSIDDQIKVVRDYLYEKIATDKELKPPNTPRKKGIKASEIGLAAKQRREAEKLLAEKVETLEFNRDDFIENNKAFYDNLQDNEKKIFECITGNPKVLDEIICEAGVQAHIILSILTDFEIAGIVKAHSGRRYSFNLNQ